MLIVADQNFPWCVVESCVANQIFLLHELNKCCFGNQNVHWQVQKCCFHTKPGFPKHIAIAVLMIITVTFAKIAKTIC